MYIYHVCNNIPNVLIIIHYMICMQCIGKKVEVLQRGFLTGRMGTHPHTNDTHLLSKHDQLGYPENKVTQSPNVLLQKQNILPCWLKKRKHTQSNQTSIIDPTSAKNYFCTEPRFPCRCVSCTNVFKSSLLPKLGSISVKSSAQYP